jgi:pimeloyl-ACP methyl ester carboxylesterase
MTSSAVRRAYVDTATGQVHVRICGEGRPLMLLHWSPTTGRHYEAALPLLAARGFRAIAPDIPGHGMSTANVDAWEIADFARALDETAQGLGLSETALVAGHLASHFAVALALTGKTRITHLVLDGTIILTPEEFGHLLRNFSALADSDPPPGVSPYALRIRNDGKHDRFPFDIAMATLREWDPSFVLSDKTLPAVYAMAADFLHCRMQNNTAYQRYDVAARLSEIACPTLALSADDEALRPAHERVLARLKHGRGHVFPGSHPLVSGRPAPYVDVIAGFLGAATG